MVIFASPNQYFIYFTEKITVVEKRELLKFQGGFKILVFPTYNWYFPGNTGKKSTTAYYILLIKSVGMNTVVHLIGKDI